MHGVSQRRACEALEIDRARLEGWSSFWVQSSMDRGYDNVMVEVSAAGAAVLYRERMPVPLSMWQPWLAWIGEPAG